MKKFFLPLFVILILSALSYSQTYKINEGFETSDSLHLPTGWSKLSVGYTTNPLWNWTVRDTGLPVPGLASAFSVAHTGLKACCVSWWCGLDTNSQQHVTNCWLITPMIHAQTGDQLKFWACGGSTLYLDSIQIWMGLDSIAPLTAYKIGSIVWPHNSTYGNFQQYQYDLSGFNGLDIWLGFCYNTDITVDGFAVYLDDVVVVNPIGIKKISSNIPSVFNLYQNYPNPFNPTTTFQFDLPKKEFVNIVLFNTLGQQLKTLLNEQKDAGSYKIDFNGSDLASGTYFYKITAGDYVKTNRMVLVK